MRIKAWMTRNDTASFILITFLCTYLIGILFNGFIRGSFGSSGFIIDTYISRIFILFGPFLAALLVSRVTQGGQAVSVLLGKLVPHGNLLWWILPVIFGMLVTGLAYVWAGVSTEDLLGIVRDHPGKLLLHFGGQLLFISIGEETGWRGWLLPNLLRKYSVVVSLALTTMIWGLWHFPVLLSGWEIVYPWLMILVAVSILLTWAWFQTNENLFVLAIIHASVNTPQFFMSDVLAGENFEEMHLEAWKVMGIAYIIISIVPLTLILTKYAVRRTQ